MHTVLLTRIIPADDDELSRLSLVKKHIAYLRKGIKLWIHPLLQTDEGEVLSFLVSIKIDVLKFFRAENSSAQHIRILLRLLKHLLAYGGYTLDDMVVSRIDYCYNIRIADDHTREVLFRLLQKCPTKAIYTTRGINYATSIYSRSKSKVIMAKVIEKRFANWHGQDFDEATLEPSDFAKAMMGYLNCECTYFPAMADDDPIISAYNYAKRESVKEGFVPVLIKADDETLWECLILNSDPDSDGEDNYAFDPDKVAEYRKKMLAAPLKDGKAVLEELINQRKEEAKDDDMDWDEEVLGEMEGGYENRRFSSYWNSDSKMTYPLILAKIPVKNPWEVFAYLPFGDWNECPDTQSLMAVAKYWFEQYGAVPAVMTHDELEFLLPTPVSQEKAMDAAVEQYGFCPDVIDQGPEEATVGALADVLRQSTVWYFWWD